MNYFTTALLRNLLTNENNLPEFEKVLTELFRSELEKSINEILEYELTAFLEYEKYDRSIVAYIISTRNDNNLVFRTYELAISRNSCAAPILHSDRGFQYTSKVFQAKLKEANITQSMSRVGRCIDNGPTEGFWESLKVRCIISCEELKSAIDAYTGFYNNERLQERFNDMTPMEVRTVALNTTNEPIQYPIKENKRIQKYYAQFNKETINYATA